MKQPLNKGRVAVKSAEYWEKCSIGVDAAVSKMTFGGRHWLMSVKTGGDEEAKASLVRVGSEQGVPVLFTGHLETEDT